MRNTSLVPLISIVTVVFNAVDTVEETIKSVINQTFNNFEYIIIDGGSNDGTLDILTKYKNEFSIFTSEKDNGIYDAMNKAIKLAKGNYIYFLGADDILFTNDTLKKISKNLVDINTIYYGNVLFKHRNEIYDGAFNKFKLATRNICHQSIFYPSDVLKKYLFKTDYKIFADYYLNIVLYFNSPFTYKYINETVALYNDKGQSGLQVLDKKFEKDRLIIFFKNAPIYIYLYRYIRSILSNLFSKKDN